MAAPNPSPHTPQSSAKGPTASDSGLPVERSNTGFSQSAKIAIDRIMNFIGSSDKAPDRILVMVSLVIALSAASFAGWEAYEVHLANQEARIANAETRVANEEAWAANVEARKANAAANDLQRQQIEQQNKVIEQQQMALDKQERELAERVQIDKSSPAVLAHYPNAVWTVKNMDPNNPITGVWLDEPRDNLVLIWKIGEVGPCKAVGVDNSMGHDPRFVYFIDGNGTHWKRLHRTWSAPSDAIYIPQRSNDPGLPGAFSNATPEFEIPGCG
jgi:hypothetical protein